MNHSLEILHELMWCLAGGCIAALAYCAFEYLAVRGDK